MVKFLEGSSFSSETVPVCTYWRSDVTTDENEDFARLKGTGDDFDDARTGGSELEDDFQERSLGAQGTTRGRCIANAFFNREDITCFNDGDCNGTGQCLPCTKYRFEGMQLGISHSPPLSFLRQFNKGVSEDTLQSPNLVSAGGNVINQVNQDQLPYGILLKNIMASIGKCCNWNVGDGAPSEFFLAQIIDGPFTQTIIDFNGNETEIRGIVVNDSVFPDEVGTFFPVGSVVVAGFRDQPSFYLEPRTGRFVNGEGVIFQSQSGVDPRNRLKSIATAATQPIIDAVNATIAVCNTLAEQEQKDGDFFNNALETNFAALIESASNKLASTQADRTVVCDAATSAQQVGNQANALIGEIVELPNDEPFADLSQLGFDLAGELSELIALVETAAISGGGTTAASQASLQAFKLSSVRRTLQQVAAGAVSKCQFFFQSNNVAAQWNSPKDGSLICNGVRTDCPFYTGEEWKFATDPNLEPGQMIKAEALQEVRFRSDDWSRFSDPEQEFVNRFAVPFIWAFKQYVDTNFTPDPEDLILYRPKVLFGKDLSVNSNDGSEFQTIEVERVSIRDFEDLSFSKSTSRIQPGSEVSDVRDAPAFPTIISEPSDAPIVSRLKVTHPSSEKTFTYRMWTPDKNKISLFGTGTPNRTIYIVNQTALQSRARYHEFFGTRDFVEGLPTSVPGAPSFTGGISATQFLNNLFLPLQDEKRLNNSPAVLGFATTSTDTTGAWQSLQEVDLVHNRLNIIHVFIVLDTVNFIVETVRVNAQFLHSLPVQKSFTGIDFSMQNAGPSGQLGINSGDTSKLSTITAEVAQLVGEEPVGFDHGYHGWRFRDRRLAALPPNPALGLLGQNIKFSNGQNILAPVGESAGDFITAVTYEVVQYRNKDVRINDWVLINDCGFILIEIPDKTAHRVLPLPNQQAQLKALSDVLVNGGTRGSVVAQFALEKATLTIRGEQKDLVQIYRDPDGFGLPANYIILGPSLDSENAFGRPVPGRDEVRVDYTYIQAQDTGLDGEQLPATQKDEVVTRNFYGDNFRSGRSSRGVFDGKGNLTVGGKASDSGKPGKSGPIKAEQQDWVYVFTDNEGRPIGRKVTRFMVLYYNLACISVEIFYDWAASCQTYALIPDLRLEVGDRAGNLTVPPKGTTDPNDPGLELGFRIESLIGDNLPCGQTPNCADHEMLQLARPLLEFEVIVNQIVDEEEGGGSGEEQESSEGSGDSQPKTILKANFPSAGGFITGEIVSSRKPGSPVRQLRGPLWYPYDKCERPRYGFVTLGPLGTDSTELINAEDVPAGINPGETIPSSGDINAGTGEFGGLVRPDLEAYRGPDRVFPKILDTHPSLRTCTSAFTYGNQVLKGDSMSFVGLARKRGEVDLFWYEGRNYTPPPFGNFGRPRLMFEIATKLGDFIDGRKVGFRWMPMFPERLDMRGGMESPFTEEMEPMHIRLTQELNPVSSLSENISSEESFTHDTLIRNRIAGTADYPNIGFWPSFLSDANIGKASPIEEDNPTISTQWAWREFEKLISRGIEGSQFIPGLQFESPEYFIDNRNFEVQLRPDEGMHIITWSAPQYDILGRLVENASIQLGDGPPREVVIDFLNKELRIAIQENTVYDTSKNLGDDPFPCSFGTLSTNTSLSTPCSCSPSVEGFDILNPFFPARFLHLDELAPPGKVALYESTTLQPPFTIDLKKGSPLSPSAMCMYHIRGLFFSLDFEFLPVNDKIDPAFSNQVGLSYTWSRVPHGFARPNGSQGALDGVFSANENLADNFVSFLDGDVFRNRAAAGSFVESFEIAAAFPSRSFALGLQNEDGNSQLQVAPLPDSQIKNGGTPAFNRISQGQEEKIILDMLFSTYVKVDSISIAFAVGKGWQIPEILLAIVDPQFRGTEAPTDSFSRIIATKEQSSDGVNIFNGGFSVNPNDSLDTPREIDRDAANQGVERGRGAVFWVTITPDYTGEPFWNQFGQEFHLIFNRRSGDNASMGIISIQSETSALASTLTERITTFERKYFTSKGSAGPDKINPEVRLQVADSATGYWRTTQEQSIEGFNKFRAYSWGPKINDADVEENTLRGDPNELEKLQTVEYDKARALLQSPYVYSFALTFPPDEKSQILFYGGRTPSSTTLLEAKISQIDEVLNQGNGNPLYGKVPKGRTPWHAPGHTWTFDFVESFAFCCKPPCPTSMVIDFNFAHLHDNLAPVETARFWDELPSGLTRILRSTEISPDPSFQGGATGGGTGQTALLDAGLLDGIPAEVLENAGFREDPETGGLIIIQRGE